jgi:hypothetical protein
MSGEPGAGLRIAAVGLGDSAPVEAALTIWGEALIPPAPVHLRGAAQDGGVALRWVRRSRAGWRWSSGGDMPLDEESERYAVRLLDGAALVRGVEMGAAGWTYDAAMIAADGTAGATLTVEVAQIGTHATGRPARMTITI